jgi:hypothetical protein
MEISLMVLVLLAGMIGLIGVMVFVRPDDRPLFE